MVPPAEGVDRFRDKEDEETSLPILPSGSRGITVTETDIATLLRERLSVDDDNVPDPENVIQSNDVLPTPLITHLWISWRKSLASE